MCYLHAQHKEQYSASMSYLKFEIDNYPIQLWLSELKCLCYALIMTMLRKVTQVAGPSVLCVATGMSSCLGHAFFTIDSVTTASYELGAPKNKKSAEEMELLVYISIV